MRRRARGIPTTYLGVRFRSRLEAKWAAFFDLLGMKWSYEPIDLDNYIPDFYLSETDTIVECKSALSLSSREFTGAQTKIEKSGWEGSGAIIVGAALLGFHRLLDGVWLPWRLARGQGFWYFSTEPGDLKRDAMANAWLQHLWREAGNKTQWKKR